MCFTAMMKVLRLCVVVELRTARMYSDVSPVYGDIGGLQAHPFS